MLRFFVPYVNEKLAAINIKGHNLLLVSTESQELAKDISDKDLSILGANRIEEVEVEESQNKQDVFLSSLAQSIHGGVVLTPPGIDLKLVVRGLESELPWMH